jgi:hypothetical protein
MTKRGAPPKYDDAQLVERVARFELLQAAPNREEAYQEATRGLAKQDAAIVRLRKARSEIEAIKDGIRREHVPNARKALAEGRVADALATRNVIAGPHSGVRAGVVAPSLLTSPSDPERLTPKGARGLADRMTAPELTEVLRRIAQDLDDGRVSAAAVRVAIADLVQAARKARGENPI